MSVVPQVDNLRMCLMCDGFDLDDVLALDAATIAEYSFLITGVEGPSDAAGAPNWAYTVGLLDRADHPELIVAGPDYLSAARVLQTLGRSVLAGERFCAGETIQLGAERFRVGNVHPIQYRLDTFNVWHAQQAIGTLRAESLEALQVFVPPEWFCVCHAFAQPVLSEPHDRVDVMPPTPNRAQQRAARRARPR